MVDITGSESESWAEAAQWIHGWILDFVISLMGSKVENGGPHGIRISLPGQNS